MPASWPPQRRCRWRPPVGEPQHASNSCRSQEGACNETCWSASVQAPPQHTPSAAQVATGVQEQQQQQPAVRLPGHRTRDTTTADRRWAFAAVPTSAPLLCVCSVAACEKRPMSETLSPFWTMLGQALAACISARTQRFASPSSCASLLGLASFEQTVGNCGLDGGLQFQVQAAVIIYQAPNSNCTHAHHMTRLKRGCWTMTHVSHLVFITAGIQYVRVASIASW